MLAMVILTLVATLAASMVWQQWRAIQVESAERERAQASWLLTGALDWARLILREDARNASQSGGNAQVDHLGEPWATPLAETKLSTFLAANRDDADGGGIDAFLSGQIIDAQSRYNLMNLVAEVTDVKSANDELEILRHLCATAGLPEDVADRIAKPLRRAAVRAGEAGEGVATALQGDGTPPEIMPERVDDLVLLGLDPEVVRRLAPFVEILPERTTVNLNTAGAEVLVAVMSLDRSSAERLIQARRAARDGLPTVPAALKLLGDETTAAAQGKNVGVASSYFEVRGRIRYEQTTVEQSSIVHRQDQNVTLVRRERVRAEAAP